MTKVLYKLRTPNFSLQDRVLKSLIENINVNIYVEVHRKIRIEIICFCKNNVLHIFRNYKLEAPYSKSE